MSWKIDDSYLPPIHRQDGGARPFQDDLLLYKWFGIKLPRWVLARPEGALPKMIAGNQIGTDRDAPRPIPEPGTYQFSIVYPRVFGKVIPGPYFAFTTNKIFGHTYHFRIGWARWTNDARPYYQLFPLAIRRDIH